MKSLNKALDILEVLLTMGGSEMRLSGLAQMTRLNKATVSCMEVLHVMKNHS